MEQPAQEQVEEEGTLSSHTVEIVDYRQLSDGQFAVAIRCCGNKMHTSWHTMVAEVVNDSARMETSILEQFQRVAALHEAALKSHANLQKLVGTTIEIATATATAPPPAPDAQASAV